MSLTTLTTKDVLKIQKLIERKESLAQQIAGINTELAAMESGGSVQAPPSNAAARSKSSSRTAKAKASPAKPQKNGSMAKSRPGGLKERVVNELKSAGVRGVKVGDLAAKLGTTYGNLNAFFITTAKNIPEIRKVGPAQFAWTK
jgi:hypothetical protein